MKVLLSRLACKSACKHGLYESRIRARGSAEERQRERGKRRAQREALVVNFNQNDRVLHKCADDESGERREGDCLSRCCWCASVTERRLPSLCCGCSSETSAVKTVITTGALSSLSRRTLPVHHTVLRLSQQSLSVCSLSLRLASAAAERERACLP